MIDILTPQPVHGVPGSVEGAPLTVDQALALATAAAPAVAQVAPVVRAGWLRAIADAVEAQRDSLVALAATETRLGTERLTGEVGRCATQLRFYADVAVDGGWLDASIDHATATAPDLRRVRRACGPVAVFGASNFPFGFGSLGNDTGSALAAGCPVVVKGHPAHPQTHRLLMDLATTALAECGAPEGTLTDVTGFDAGRELVLHPGIRAVAFTGSQQGGMALHALAWTRAVPVPVYAEMGTVNPVVVTAQAAAERAATIGAGAVGSFTLGMGQFCTKPGLVLVPAGSRVLDEIITSLAHNPPRGELLTSGIAAAYAAGIDTLVRAGGQLVAHVPDPGEGDAVSAVVLTAHPDALVPGSPLLAECFGPVVLVVEYDGAAQRDEVLGRLQGALVASIMSGGADDPEVPGLVTALAGMVGRVAVDAWPTGVATTWAQHHGGPWPSTTDPSATSVGAAALDRFTRPVAYQGLAEAYLPPALRDQNTWAIPRRVDGRVRTARART